jgi:hypothetical protein
MDTLQRIWRKCAESARIAATKSHVLILLAVTAGCQPAEKPVTADIDAGVVTSACAAQGYLATNLYGAITGALDWQPSSIECEGMPRPNSQGARLRFAGSEGERQLAIIIALPELERGAMGLEMVSNVTLIEEGSGRFFSTADRDTCWTDITGLEPLDDVGDRYLIAGTLYCVSPLAEVNGDSSVSIDELLFRGLLDWSAS